MRDLTIGGEGISLPRETPRFSAQVIREALRVITDKGYGYSEELPNLLEERVKGIKTPEEAKNLIRVLEILGFISNGFVRENNRYKSTWKATDKAYREIYPLWRYIFKTLFGK